MKKLSLREAITFKREEGEVDQVDDIASLLAGDTDQSEDPDMDTAISQASEDPNRQGLIRVVPSAHLVYKREDATGGFEELWMYNHNDITDELKIRKAILAGTDIPTNKTSSPDGKQKYTIWTAGNAEMLHITGLPN